MSSHLPRLYTLGEAAAAARLYWPLPPREAQQDVEEICRGVLTEAIRRGTAPRDFQTSDYDDSLRHLLGEVHAVLTRFNPEAGADKHGRNVRVGAYLYDRLGLRLIDYWRSPASGFGKRGEHRVLGDLPELDGGEEQLLNAGRSQTLAGFRSGRGDRLDGVASADTADGAAVGGWLDPEGDRGTTRRPRGEGRADRRPAASSDAGAAAGGVGRPAAFHDCKACGWRSYRQSPNGVDRWHLPPVCAGCGKRILEALPPVEAETKREGVAA